MKSSFLRFINFVSIISIALILESCTCNVSKLPYKQPESYLSPKYEDKSFENVSMDICYPILDFNIPPEGADTVLILNMKEFHTAFKKYFPEGIKMFSTVTNTGWIFFEWKNYANVDIIEYRTKTKDGLDFNIFLEDSLAIFRRQSNSDFIMMFHMIYTTKNLADSENKSSKYSTIINLDYSIWDRMTGDLVGMDKVSATMEFDRLSGSWPYRGALMKTAALIFEKMPMFQK